MRSASAPSELVRLGSPLLRLVDGAWKRMHWWVVIMGSLYAFSGITVIRADEVAIVERWGRLVGGAAGVQEHGPGLLFALPKPIDRVVRVQTKHVSQLLIQTLADPSDTGQARAGPPSSSTLDPLAVGYALTGDQNIVQLTAVARYRVREPANWAFYGPKSETILRVEVSAALVRSLGELGVDRILAEGRKELIATATRRAQAGLDAAHAGLALVSLELTQLAPPRALAANFDAVQTAYIQTETQKKEALSYAQGLLPAARAQADAAVQSARAAAAEDAARARGAAEKFLALETEYRANPVVLRERLYRDAVERAIRKAQGVQWVPPPVGPRYQGLRIEIAPERTAPRLTEEPR